MNVIGSRASFIIASVCYSTHWRKKGTKSKCKNYRGITLLPTAYKLFANMIRNRLNEHLEDELVEEQCGFRKGRSCTDAIFTVQQIIEKRKEHNLQLFLLFIDYEKAYDNMNRDKLWEMMENKIPNYLLSLMEAIPLCDMIHTYTSVYVNTQLYLLLM